MVANLWGDDIRTMRCVAKLSFEQMATMIGETPDSIYQAEFHVREGFSDDKNQVVLRKMKDALEARHGS